MMEKNTVLTILRDTLRFHKKMGIVEYHDSPQIRQFLNPLGKSTNSPEKNQPISEEVEPVFAKDLTALEKEIVSCAQCQLADSSSGKITGRGKPGCRLLFVGDYSHQPEAFSRETLFGSEEDVMLSKMIEAIGFNLDQVYITNALKCCPRDPEIIDKTCEEKCFSFLAREIAAVSPDVICAMGDMAARVILGRKDPLARIRGRFLNYRSLAGKQIGVMPTFHPRFLLEQPAMKKATWNDLQAIMAKLSDSSKS